MMCTLRIISMYMMVIPLIKIQLCFRAIYLDSAMCIFLSYISHKLYILHSRQENTTKFEAI
jgi:hypothetical protein